jgi:tetratricopeptide (TPR) repeat protein
MDFLFICAIIAATAALYVIARKEQRYKTQSYALTVIIPIIALIVYFTFISPRPETREELPMGQKEMHAQLQQTLKEDETALKEKLAQNPNDPELTGLLANTLMEQTHYDEAAKLLETALAVHPDNKDLITRLSITHFAKGLFLAEQKKYTQALASLQTAKAINQKGGAPYNRDLDMFIKIIERKADPKSTKPIIDIPMPAK